MTDSEISQNKIIYFVIKSIFFYFSNSEIIFFYQNAMKIYIKAFNDQQHILGSTTLKGAVWQPLLAEDYTYSHFLRSSHFHIFV